MKITNQTDQIIRTSTTKNNNTTLNSKSNIADGKVRIRLNMVTAVPQNSSLPNPENEPDIWDAGQVVEVHQDLAEKWTTETYQLSPTKMCERKGGDFLPTEYITRASYV